MLGGTIPAETCEHHLRYQTLHNWIHRSPQADIASQLPLANLTWNLLKRPGKEGHRTKSAKPMHTLYFHIRGKSKINLNMYIYICVCVSYVNIAVLNKYFNICKRIIRAMFGFQIAYHGPSLHYPRAQSSPGHSTIFHLTTCQLPIRQIGVGPHEWEREPCTLAGSYNEFQLPKRYESQLGSSPGFEHQQL